MNDALLKKIKKRSTGIVYFAVPDNPQAPLVYFYRTRGTRRTTVLARSTYQQKDKDTIKALKEMQQRGLIKIKGVNMEKIDTSIFKCCENCVFFNVEVCKECQVCAQNASRKNPYPCFTPIEE